MLPDLDEGIASGALGELVDCCSDIRAVYARIQERGPSEKLDGQQAVAQAQDTQTLLLLEQENRDPGEPCLDLLYDTLLGLGLDPDRLDDICQRVLPKERFDQLLIRKHAVAA